MSLSRAEERRRYRDARKRWIIRLFGVVVAATVAVALGTWLWVWTGEPAFFE